ncbi:serine hydrolase FSH [Xylaria intraflava]|nr:serine hydrolase FSH [Xylaria intraflava]
MANETHPGAPAPATEVKAQQSNIPPGKTELKILMLHGFTQSGPLFSSKTKALSKLLTKALSQPPLNLHPTLIYPSAPHRLLASDIPGFIPPEDAAPQADEDLDNWAWFRMDLASGTYRGLSEGMAQIASAISAAGGVDGVMGFSQGGCMAALVAAALERRDDGAPWARELRAANGGRPLRFAVVYSGFYAPPADLQWLYDPPVATPTLHFIGGLDTVVDENRSRALVERCRDPVVLTHPGGHYVPVARDWVMPLVGWLKQRCEAAGGENSL